VALMIGVGCNGVHYDKPLAHSSPLLRSEWRPLMPRPTSTIDYDPSGGSDDREPAESGDGDATDVRATMVAAAQALLADRRPRAEYGLTDVEQALGRAIPGQGWRASQGLERLVELAKTRF